MSTPTSLAPSPLLAEHQSGSQIQKLDGTKLHEECCSSLFYINQLEPLASASAHLCQVSVLAAKQKDLGWHHKM